MKIFISFILGGASSFAAADFIKRNQKPVIEKWHNKYFLKSEDFLNNLTLTFGIGIGELHRQEPIESNWAPMKVLMPLIDHDINIQEVLQKYNLKKSNKNIG